MNHNLPKVLLLGHSFNDYDGIGITLANLFNSWTQDKIAIVAPIINIGFSTKKQLCKTFFNTTNNTAYFTNTFVETENSRSIFHKEDKRSSIRKRLSSFLQKRVGINDIIDRKPVTKELIDFINNFHPDIIYTCLGTYSSIKYVNKICTLTDNRYPLAIHIMDDWPATLFNSRYFRRFWRKKYHKAFTRILQRSILNLSICKGMSEEYARRYGLEFFPFHNPVDPDIWDRVPNKPYTTDMKMKKIVFFGKINADTQNSLLDMCDVCQDLNEQGIQIQFDIYSPNYSKEIADLFGHFQVCHILPSIPHEKVKNYIKQYDIIFFPFCFSDATRHYLKWSMSTSTAEYMISKVPILLYCPKELEQYKYAAGKKWAYCISQRNTDLLATGLKKLITDTKLRDQLIENAYRLALSNHNLNYVCEDYKTKFITAVRAHNAK